MAARAAPGMTHASLPCLVATAARMMDGANASSWDTRLLAAFIEVPLIVCKNSSVKSELNEQRLVLTPPP
ncbi:hypothetical protein E2C01_081548 [Portunus trituberculatus]|uniref:Uncharacterized protein n=1 Tax=Portunus trituberculatus TaxID=210409 RepID=A0A5B7IS67_PORTR|nr:hypothetical protein [Portunus trituberculatus]